MANQKSFKLKFEKLTSEDGDVGNLKKNNKRNDKIYNITKENN